MSIVIAGGTKGIGLEIATHFSAQGRTVLLVFGSDQRAADAAKERAGRAGGRVELVQADIGSPAGCEAVARASAQLGEPVDVVVHSAVQAIASDVLEVDEAAFSRAIAVNGTSLLFLVRALLPQLRSGSSVIYLTSRGGRVVIPKYAAVGVAKALAESLMRYLAVELAPRGVRINAIAPSIVDTEAVRTLFGEATDGILRQSAQSNPSGRGIEAADYLAVVDFLTGPSAGFVQGQVIYVNGGSNLMA